MYHNLKIAIRNLCRNGIYSVINITGLAVSLAAVIIITLWVDNELTFNRWYSNSDRLFVPCSDDGATGISEPLIKSFQTEYPEVKSISNFTNDANVILYTKEDDMNRYNELGAFVDSTLFGMLDIKLLRGSAQSVFQSPYAIVLSESMAKKIFGKDDPIGKTLHMDGYAEIYQVTGVFKAQPANSSFRFQWLIPFEALTKREGWDPVNGWNLFKCCLELQPNVDINALNSKLKDAEKKRTGSDEDTFLYPITQLHLYGEFVDGKPIAGKRARDIRELSLIAAIILLISCINFINLATARSEKRMMEMGVRKVFGARRYNLIRQIMRESVILISISLALALVVVMLILPLFSQWWHIDLSVQLLDVRQFCGIMSIGLICTILTGLYPAFYISAFHPVDILKKLKNRTSNGAAWIRRGLVMFQFATAFVLLCVTIVVFLQIHHGQVRPLGYDKENLIRVSGVRGMASQSVIRDELAKSVMVNGVAFANDPLVIQGSTSTGFQWQGKNADINPTIQRSNVSSAYIETIGFKLLKGRGFYESSTTDARCVIINKTLANMMGDEGRTNGELWQGNRERAIIYTIVGIIDDYISNDIYRKKSEPLMLFYDRGSSPLLYVRFNAQTDIGSALKMVQSALSQFPTDRPLDYVFVDDLVNRMFDNQRQEGFLVALFSILSMLVSCLGLFGLVTYIAESKTKENGIRRILGASVGNLVAMLTKEFLILVTLSALIASPLAYYWINKMLQDYEYRIFVGWEIFASAMLITIALTLFTVGWQARKAATANPVNALKTE